jgi:hypothetical protein
VWHLLKGYQQVLHAIGSGSGRHHIANGVLQQITLPAAMHTNPSKPQCITWQSSHSSRKHITP